MKLIPYFERSEQPMRSLLSPTQLFEDFFNEPFFGLTPNHEHTWMPSVDILEKNGELVLNAEIPGMTEKEVELKIEGNTLTLSGERKMEKEEKGNYHRIESFYGAFSRSFTLPDTADTEKIKAECKNGVLTVTIPKKPEAKPREIPVMVH